MSRVARPTTSTTSARRRRTTNPPPPVHDLDGMLRRLHLPTIRRLYGELMTRAEAEGMSYHTYLETLMAEEIAHRAQTRLTRAVRAARFPFLRTIDDFNFNFQTALKLQMLGSFLGPELVHDGKNAILSGPSGTGKTHLAIAIAYRALQHGYDARFVGADALIGELSRAAAKGKLEHALIPYQQPHVLIIDELGFVPLSKTGAELLFELISQRYERGATLITSNLPFDEWTETLGSERLTGALLDRITHHVNILEMNGDSYRLAQSRARKAG